MSVWRLVSITLFTFLFSIFAFAVDSHTILLKTRAFTPKAVSLTFSDLAQYSGQHILVQFEKTPTSAEREKISTMGIKLLQSIPYNAYIAFIEQKDWTKNKALTPFRWVGKLLPEDKVHPRIQLGELDVHVIGDDGLATFYVYCHGDVSKDRCFQVLENIGAEILAYTPALNMFSVRIEPYRYEEVAELDEVMWVAEPTPPFGLYNNKARAITGVDIAHGAPYFITGAGIKVLIYDGGYVLNSGGNATHPDLSGRVIYPETFPAPDIYGHATHVSCTVAGTGAASGGLYMGMAPNVVQIISMAYTPMIGPIFYNNLGDIEDNYKTAIYLGAQVANNSIGSNVAANNYNCSWEGDYEGAAALIDKLIYGLYGPIVIVWAAGNERGYGRCGSSYGTIPPPCPAKNTISVGATNAEDDSMTDFSSWGPTDDGRIRPDVVAPGSSHDGGIKSCFYGSSYMKMSGTSMASPVVTGCVALAYEMWQRTMGAIPISASLMKALIIHGADDLDAPGPDYTYGYGRVYIPRTLDLISSRSFLEITLEQDSTYARRFKATGTEPFKVTLVWIDPAGPILSGKDLVNDLDLVVMSPDGSANFPFVLDPQNPQLFATRGVDSTNPVEQVLIEKPEANGIYEVKIRGTYVPQGPQSAALVFSGAEICAEEEICDNGIDDNCDGEIDEGCNNEDSGDDDDSGASNLGGCGC